MQKSRVGTCLHLPYRYWSEIGYTIRIKGMSLHIPNTNCWGYTPLRENRRYFINWASLRPAQLINFCYACLTKLCLCIRLLYMDMFYLGWFWGSKCNENCKRKFCSVRILFTNHASLHVTHYRCSKLFIAQVARARNMSIGEHRHCCVTFEI